MPDETIEDWPDYENDYENEELTPTSRWSRLTGPFASALVHAVLLVILAFTVSAVKQFQEEEPASSFTMTQEKDREPPPDDLSHDHEPPDEPTDSPWGDFGDTLDFPSQTPDLSTTVTNPEPAPATATPLVLTKHPHSRVHWKAFAGRNAAGRKAALGRFRAGTQGEVMVIKALNWLKENQIKTGAKAGTWPTSPGSGAPMAGFGLLTFLAHNKLPDSPEYGDTVALAIDYLLRTQSEDGKWNEEGAHAYGHAIATMAVSEAYAMTRHPSLKYAMERGVGRIIDGTILVKTPARDSMLLVRPYDTSTDKRVTSAFWDYHYENGAWPQGTANEYMDGDQPMRPRYAAGVRKDHSFMGFQIQALKAATFANSKHPKLAETLRAAANGVKFMHTPSQGSFAYQSLTDNPVTSGGRSNQLGVGAYCLALLKPQGRDEPEFERATAAIRATPFNPAPSRTFYRMYYKSYANVLADKGRRGPNFAHYHPPMESWLATAQNADGSWSDEAPGQTDAHGLVYPTCLGALSLMAPYRYEMYGPPAAPISAPHMRDLQVKLEGGDFDLN